MTWSDLDLPTQMLQAPMPQHLSAVDLEGWLLAARHAADGGARLVAMWGHEAAGRPHVLAAYAQAEGLLCVDLPLGPARRYPDLSNLFACAARMQRAIADLSGLHADGAADERPWLDHGLWGGTAPLAAGSTAGGADLNALPADYGFVRVEGDGVHEIAVGPVHAGIIEPGHFRFSVVGEKVLRLEQHLGYTHKGVEQRFAQLDPLQAHRLAGRVSGDSTVAYAWAYCMALESAWHCQVPERAAWLAENVLQSMGFFAR